jgi:hypothetical protein
VSLIAACAHIDRGCGRPGIEPGIICAEILKTPRTPARDSWSCMDSANPLTLLLMYACALSWRLQYRTIASLTATSATSDEQLVASWVANLRWEHSRINSGRRLIASWPLLAHRCGERRLRRCARRSKRSRRDSSSARQVVLRVKSLLSYGHHGTSSGLSLDPGVFLQLR